MSMLRRALALLACAAVLAPAAAPAAPPRPELLQDPQFLERARRASGDRRTSLRAAARAAAAARTAPKNAVTAGTLRPLVLLVDFPDRPHNATGHEPSQYAAMLFSVAGLPYPNSANTVRDYFDEVSRGALRLGGDEASVRGWARLASPLATYAGDDRGYALGGRLVADAVAALDATVDFGQFDDDGPDGIPNSGDDDGYVDALLVVHAGWGWEDSGRDEDLASHYSTTLLATDDAAAGGGTIRVADYALVPEESYKLDLVVNREAPPSDNGNEPLAEIGVYAHELGHLLGLPDLYDTTFQSLGVGNYCLMGYGLWGANYPQPLEHNRLSNSPTHLSPWAKWRLGWLEPTPVWTDGELFDLERVEDAAMPRTLVLYADSPGREYFLLEHRASVGFDATFSSVFHQGGLVLWHVDEAVVAAGGAAPNDDWTRKGVDVVCASGLDDVGADDLDNALTFASTAHWYVAPAELPVVSAWPGPPDSRSNLGTETGITLMGLSGPSAGDYPWQLTARMTGTASAGAVVRDPLDLAVTPGDHALDLSWSPSPAADVVGYRLYYAAAGGAETRVEVGDATSHRLGGLGEHAPYLVRVTALDADGHESAGAPGAAQTLDTVAPTALAAPAGRLSNAPVVVTLAASEPAALYYTLDGAAPTTGSTLYDGAVTVDRSATLRFVAVDDAGNVSAVYAEAYVIDLVSPTAAAAPGGRVSRTPVEVALSMSEPGSLHFTLDGSAPTPSSPRYAGPLTIAESTTLRFLAVDDAGNPSPAYAETYTIDTAAPTVSAAPGGVTFSQPLLVALSADEPATIRYTVDGSEPTSASPAYSGPLPFNATTTLKFFGIDAAGNEGTVVTEEYVYEAPSGGGGGGGGGGGCFVVATGLPAPARAAPWWLPALLLLTMASLGGVIASPRPPATRTTLCRTRRSQPASTTVPCP